MIKIELGIMCTLRRRMWLTKCSVGAKGITDILFLKLGRMYTEGMCVCMHVCKCVHFIINKGI